eukprot:TRINITY_DN7217_c0_g3_i2.p1 TRINITY_DN7217_c0_g3~~TRINITY_DN7217_c0_g3_i2.p1  ORF type:complete len:435 (-),score=106.81 TRINITY_DN7217_c0_g3_i2:242-1546(-)
MPPTWCLMVLAALVALFAVLQLIQLWVLPQRSKHHVKSVEFASFQRKYLFVYLTIFLADWLQGTNMYTLYMSYEVDVGALFLTGFGVSGICSMVVGPYIDKHGRKQACVLYCLLEIVINFLEHFSDFRVLMVGRVLGGLSTALLFTALESWMVTEHRKHGYSEQLLADTFSMAATGNGLVAVLAGVLAQLMANTFGEIGPFQLAIGLTVVALMAISLTWSENYGDTNKKGQPSVNHQSALAVVLQDRNILLVGMIQSLFEGAMYTFVFNWVPTLIGLWPQDAGKFGEVQGIIFSCFMVCMSIGGSSFGLLERIAPVQHFSTLVLGLGGVSMLMPVVSTDLSVILVGFFVMEACVGLFSACMSTMRSMVVPESMSASVMNIFRVPLNLLVVMGTKLDNYASTGTVFAVCFSWLAVAALLQSSLSARLKSGEAKVE